jgi:hypothetical protein
MPRRPRPPPGGGQNFFANRPKFPHRQAKTTALFRVPQAVIPTRSPPCPKDHGITQQKISGTQRFLYDLPEPADPSEVC